MRLYLSSFKVGEQADFLSSLYGDRPVGYLANALDHVGDRKWLEDWISSDIEELARVGVNARLFDLRDFFTADATVGQAVSEFSGLWVSGGNVFVLRQAMKLSGLDGFLLSDHVPRCFVYGGYSAGSCVLSPSLRPYGMVDDPDVDPYGQNAETIWEGLGVLDFTFIPHFRSQHSETERVEQGIKYCQDHGVPYQTFRDGDVLIV